MQIIADNPQKVNFNDPMSHAGIGVAGKSINLTYSLKYQGPSRLRCLCLC